MSAKFVTDAIKNEIQNSTEDQGKLFMTFFPNSWVGLHQCWWQMLETKYVCDSFKMLMTVLAVFFTNILYLLISFNVGHQHAKNATNIEILSLIPITCHQHKVTNNHFSPTSVSPPNGYWVVDQFKSVNEILIPLLVMVIYQLHCFMQFLLRRIFLLLPSWKLLVTSWLWWVFYWFFI